VHLQRKQHVLENETLLLRNLSEQEQQEKEKVLKVRNAVALRNAAAVRRRENVRTYSFFLKKV